MNYYGEKEVANALRLLDKMRNEYPKEEEKYKALSIAIDSIFNDGIHIMREIDGDTSDGYHTFNELYHHRAILFSVIVKTFSDKAWKSLRHHDGTMYDGMFIVGIDTPDGQATYHYDINPYWDMFECRELECAPEWDGHTPAQAIERIGGLEPVRYGRWVWDNDAIDWNIGAWVCSECGGRNQNIQAGDPNDEKEKFKSPYIYLGSKYCPNCGAKMESILF